MASIVIYTTINCPFCTRAKELIQSKGASFQEVRVDSNPEKLNEMLEKSSGRRTVPQIFIGETHVGGFDDLKALNDKGELDSMLN